MARRPMSLLTTANMTPQAPILAPVPRAARSLFLRRRLTATPVDALSALASVSDALVGIGPGLLTEAGQTVAGIRRFPGWSGPAGAPPSTPFDGWIRLLGSDRGDVAHDERRVRLLLGGAFEVVLRVDEFQHGDSRDLTGYEDGTENPTGSNAEAAALVADGPLAGSSFAAVQVWEHDLAAFGTLTRPEQDNAIGRRRSDNEELDDAPPSAHVKRTAQKDFEPEAFVVRRSLPWADGDRQGLLFVAFAASFDPFEAQWRRMLGLDDGVPDALFRFTRPTTGSYFWCPPRDGDRLYLRGATPAARP